MSVMLKFSVVTSKRLMTISVRHILGGAWWVLWCILALPEGSERNPWVKLSEVS